MSNRIMVENADHFRQEAERALSQSFDRFVVIGPIFQREDGSEYFCFSFNTGNEKGPLTASLQLSGDESSAAVFTIVEVCSKLDLSVAITPSYVTYYEMMLRFWPNSKGARAALARAVADEDSKRKAAVN